MELSFRPVVPTDIPKVADLETSSYPEDEAASKSTLQYRQHYAAKYFRCCVVEDKVLIGFICATRCWNFDEESLKVHVSDGPLLAIHSVVVHSDYRRRGVATEMLKDYVLSLQDLKDVTIQKVVLMAKAPLLSLYVKSGFEVRRQSAIVHGQDPWYDLEYSLKPPFAVVNAFVTDQLGSGNPAAVVLLLNNEEKPSSEWMQLVAAEFNLSETAFVWRQEGEHQIRFFTPTTEIPLCGHATLASASVLLKQVDEKITLNATQDVLMAQKIAHNRVALTFPAKSVQAVDDLESVLAPALGIASDDIIYIGAVKDIGDLLVEVTTEAFENLEMKLNLLDECQAYTRGLIVCALSNDNQSQVWLRFFHPKGGIDEDPVTGSAHCALAPYICAKLGVDKITSYQRSARGGIIECTLLEEEKAVRLVGRIRTTRSGTLWL